MLAKTNCGNPVFIKTSFNSPPFTKPSLSVSSVRNNASDLVFSSNVTTHDLNV